MPSWQNSVLETQTSIPASVAERIAQQTLRRRGQDYAGEVRRLLDAGLEVMARCGTSSRPRVADIVEAAGLSNDAFYRHFPSKDALVAAILDDGAERLQGYLAHRMAKADRPEAQVRAWVEGLLSQADEAIAATTLAVLWNGGSTVGGRHAELLAPLLVEPLTALGSDDPDATSVLLAHAGIGRLHDLLWAGRPPRAADVEQLTAFCLRAGAGPPPSGA
jgi:AcrR family transcriptional regulator